MLLQKAMQYTAVLYDIAQYRGVLHSAMQNPTTTNNIVTQCNVALDNAVDY